LKLHFILEICAYIFFRTAPSVSIKRIFANFTNSLIFRCFYTPRKSVLIFFCLIYLKHFMQTYLHSLHGVAVRCTLILGFAFAFLALAPAYAQRTVTTDLPMDGNWQTFKSEKGITLSYKRLECHNPSQGTHYERVLFRIWNDNPTAVRVSWDRKYWYDLNECHNCTDNRLENHSELVLSPGQILESTCARDVEELCLTTARLDGRARPMVAFDFANFTVEQP
jgi:hypothetical protein